MSSYIEKIETAIRIHQNYPGAWSHSMIFQRIDILNAFDMVIEAFPNEKVTIHYRDEKYYILIEFKRENEQK
tara:strand:- start:43 stop:258 length:216 start_codon:yes stop_codon:yes gene_type:complete